MNVCHYTWQLYFNFCHSSSQHAFTEYPPDVKHSQSASSTLTLSEMALLSSFHRLGNWGSRVVKFPRWILCSQKAAELQSQPRCSQSRASILNDWLILFLISSAAHLDCFLRLEIACLEPLHRYSPSCVKTKVSNRKEQRWVLASPILFKGCYLFKMISTQWPFSGSSYWAPVDVYRKEKPHPEPT